MIGTIVGTYYASEKGAGWGKAALIGIGTDFAIGVGSVLLSFALGFGITQAIAALQAAPASAGQVTGNAVGSALSGAPFGAAGSIRVARISGPRRWQPRVLGGNQGVLRAVRVR